MRTSFDEPIQPPPPPVDEMKKCPFCAERIQAEATKCRYCGEFLTEKPPVVAPKAGGKWNTYEITAKGSQLTVVLNGQKTVDVQDSKHAAGPFALQYGSGVIKFRKVYIKPL